MQIQKETFVCDGAIYIGGLPVGNAGKAEHSYEYEKLTTPNRMGGGGDYDSLTQVKSAGLEITLDDFTDANLAKAMQAKHIDIPAALQEMVKKPAVKGGIVSLDYLIDTGTGATVTDTDAAQTFTAGTDYNLTPFGIEVLAAGAIEDGEELEITATSRTASALEVAAAQQLEFTVMFAGYNETNGQPVMVQYHKFKIAPMESYDFLASGFQTLTLKGDLLPDNTKGAGFSKYQRIVKNKSAA